MNQKIFRVINAFNKVAEQPEEVAAPANNKVESLPEPKNNTYAIIFLTKGYTDDRGGVQSIQYGHQMADANYARKEVEDGGFERHGDNFRWFRVYWVFDIADKTAIYQADLSPLGKVIGNESISFTGEEIRLNDKVISVQDIKNNSNFFPLDNSGKLKMITGTGEVPLAGNVFFVDGSDNKSGTLDQSRVSQNAILSLRKASPSSPQPGKGVYSHSFVGDDLTGNNYRIWNGQSLVKLNGEPDKDSTKVVIDILNRPPEQDAQLSTQEGAEKGHQFEPQGESIKRQQGAPEKQAGITKSTPGQVGSPAQTSYAPSNSEQAKNRLKDTTNRLQDSKKGIQNAQKALQDAKRLERLKKAEDELTSSVEEAQKALQDAKKEHKSLMDLKRDQTNQLNDAKKKDREQSKNPSNTYERNPSNSGGIKNTQPSKVSPSKGNSGMKSTKPSWYTHCASRVVSAFLEK